MDSESELKSAYEYCEGYAKSHYENFPVASMLFPKNKRKYVHSVYSFARIADDIADSDNLSSNEKILRLEQYEKYLFDSLSGCYQKIKNEYKLVFSALIDTINTFKISEIEFTNLLKAFKQDAVKNRYRNFNELINYSENSANPVGHIVLAISGFKAEDNAEIYKYSDRICTALQLTNFWQDVSRDLKINRIYIPSDLMESHSYDEKSLFAGIENDNLKELISDLTARTRNIFEEGKPLMEELKGKLNIELKAVYNGGMCILKKIEDIDCRVLSKRVELNFKDKFRIFSKAIF